MPRTVTSTDFCRAIAVNLHRTIRPQHLGASSEPFGPPAKSLMADDEINFLCRAKDSFVG